MGRPVSRIHSPTSALDFVRDKVRNHAGGYPKMKILALELSTARGSLAWLNSEEGPARANAPACRDPGREGACATRKDDIDLFEREWPNDRKNSAALFKISTVSRNNLVLRRL